MGSSWWPWEGLADRLSCAATLGRIAGVVRSCVVPHSLSFEESQPSKCRRIYYEQLVSEPEGPEYAPFVSAYPASSIAALAAYWAAHTRELIALEQSRPARCRRVRYEDLKTASDDQAAAILALLRCWQARGLCPPPR
jgi:hypothetical protein